jgi:AraC family transcriptional regulator of adaptative response/methylated-DNA-[protein]-cysteine methyltransferase
MQRQITPNSVTAVQTTGIFCRNGCSARPKPENTLHLESAADALFAGYRPCLRCQRAISDSPRAQRGLRRVALLSQIRRPRRARAVEGLVRLALLGTPLGPMVAGVVPLGLALLEFADRPMLETQLNIVQKRFRARLEPGRTALHDRAQSALEAYFAGEAQALDLPVATPGTPFQEDVWEALRRIPVGGTESYAGLAAELGRPAAVRAVGHANGMNRLALVIPCHRVIASDGGLGGYGGGTWRKAWLLDHEARLSGDSPWSAGKPVAATAALTDQR